MNTTLQLLAGNEDQFRAGLVDLGWFNYPPTLTGERPMGRARLSLDPKLYSAGEVAGTGASVYRLTLNSHRWQDAVKVVESHIHQRPHFAVVFVTLPRAVMIVVPEDPDKARNRNSGIQVAQIFLDTTRHDRHADEIIKRLKAAKREGFRKKLQDSADIKRVTDGFYKAFDKQKDAFIGFIEDVGSLENKQWYASVLLNRLMFIYFIQSNGIMAPGYLRAKLDVHAGKGRGYYREFLCALFFDGLAVEQNKRTEAVKTLLGEVPYLNGGLFMPHKLENENPSIAIADEAFYALFKLFDEYTWYIDDRPIARDRELNPDVLGYIFEKYVNQKQMGAYYTKEDITGYICRNTIIPRLFDMLAEARGVAEFRLPIKEIEPYIWDAVKHGVEEPLPDYIEPGVNDVSLRSRWNEAAPATYALPTETWRELIARRQRYAAIHADFVAGKITTANDFITYNLNLPLAALDFVNRCTDASILSDLYFKCLQRITVLDPTCGSGAFLFAALNILYPLYEACLDRMEELKSADRIEDDRLTLTMKGEFDFANEVDAQQTFMDPEIDPYTVTRAVLERCQAELERIAIHANRAYYIHKTIIVNNLYGVDIMEEAVEICKLRLFLNLISHADPDPMKKNLGIEPLPDIDFNILAGNTLVGYTSIADIDRQWHKVLVEQSRLNFEKDHSRLRTLVDEYGRLVDTFRKQQLGEELHLPIASKDAVHRARKLVQPELDEDLWKLYRNAKLYDDPPRKRLKSFQHSHQPIHWFLEFPREMSSGGFDAVVGNPPYVERSKFDGGYSPIGLKTAAARDIYAWVVERNIALRCPFGRTGVIIPISFASSDSFAATRQSTIDPHVSSWVSHFSNRPSPLFEGAQSRLTILLQSTSVGRAPALYSTKYYRWDGRGGERVSLFERLQYIEVTDIVGKSGDLLPKTGPKIAHAILSKLLTRTVQAQHKNPSAGHSVYWVRVPGYFCQFFLSPPMARPIDGGPAKIRGEVLSIALPDEEQRKIAHAILNSSTYFQYYTAFSDGRHINPSDVTLAIGLTIDISDYGKIELQKLSGVLASKLASNTTQWKKSGLLIDSADSARCKEAIDDIDRVLGAEFHLTAEEVDYIINYDIKYRLGKGGEGEADV